MRIAIVEDEAVYQQQLREYLKKYEEEFRCALQVSVFDSGMSFVHSFSSQFDIILLDVAMPYIDGIDTAQKYGGSITTGIEDDWFVLKMLIPLRSSEQ